jgi:hypothetical protein
MIPMLQLRFWMRLKTALLVAFGFFSASVGTSVAHADGLVAASILPFSSGSATYPTAFSGFGYGIGFTYQDPGTPYAGTIRMTNQGDGSLYALVFLYYVKGKIWPVTPDPNRQDVTLQLRPRFWSIYLEAGPALYSATQNISNAQGSGTVTVTGATVLFSAGMERPFGNYLGGIRVNYFNSTTNPVHALSGELSIGLPIGI